MQGSQQQSNIPQQLRRTAAGLVYRYLFITPNGSIGKSQFTLHTEYQHRPNIGMQTGMLTPYSPKTTILGPDLDGTSEIFGRKTALALEVLRVNGP